MEATDNKTTKKPVENELWVDIIKIFACVLVVVGHLTQSLVKSGIFQDNEGWQKLNTGLYFFHVHLFFICSGYLFQKYSHIRNIWDYGAFILKKVKVLVIPYFIFSTITWALKNVFSGSVNEQVNGLAETYFVSPVSPYWYLYALFLMMLIAPVIKWIFDRWWTSIPGLAAGMWLVYLSFSILHAVNYPVDIFLQKFVWFVIGMFVAGIKLPAFVKGNNKYGRVVVIMLGAGLSIYAGWFLKNVLEGIIRFNYYQYVTGYVICFAIVVLAIGLFGPYNSGKIVRRLTSYVMPVFLIHTICASCFRIVLTKMGIVNGGVHLVAGFVVSVAGPVVLYEMWKYLLKYLKK